MTEPTKVSFSRVDCWKDCPRKYYFRYVERVPLEPDYSPTNPLILGSTLDKGLEHGFEEAERYYWSRYHVATNEGETELMKIEYWLEQLRPKLHDGKFQTTIETEDFIGFADYIENNLLVDFKYSNNTEKYAESPQIHVYASMLNPRPEYLGYVCIPKTGIRQKQFKPGKKGKKDVPGEDIHDFRRRVMDELKKMEIQYVWVDYDQDKVDQFWQDADQMKKDRTWDAKPNENKCKWCDYRHICDPKIILNPVAERPITVKKLKPRSQIKLNY